MCLLTTNCITEVNLSSMIIFVVVIFHWKCIHLVDSFEKYILVQQGLGNLFPYPHTQQNAYKCRENFPSIHCPLSRLFAYLYMKLNRYRKIIDAKIWNKRKQERTKQIDNKYNNIAGYVKWTSHNEYILFVYHKCIFKSWGKK